MIIITIMIVILINIVYPLKQYSFTAFSVETMFQTILRTRLSFTIHLAVQTIYTTTYTILEHLLSEFKEQLLLPKFRFSDIRHCTRLLYI